MLGAVRALEGHQGVLGLAGSVGILGPEGVQGHWGLLWGVGVC